MRLSDVIFLGGPYPKFTSVGIRCVEIARRLGCDYALNIRSLEDIPLRYKAYVCVKPRLRDEDLKSLAQRGPVIWDVLDHLPENTDSISHYIASTAVVRDIIKDRKPVALIPHHHCNYSAVPNPASLRRPGWIGNMHWYPKLNQVEHDVYDVTGMTRKDVEDSHRKIGIGLNIRAFGPGHEEHAILNAGIKLINCIGFGIPSVSVREPPYLEIGDGCTTFVDATNCRDVVNALQNDDHYFEEMRENCIRKSGNYHISRISGLYRTFLESL